MRRVYRESLSDDTMARLCERTFQIGTAGLQHAKLAHRIEARKKRAKDLWDAERTIAFNEIDRVLRRQALIVSYAKACARGDAPLALHAQRALCRHPLASVLSTLMDLLGSPRGALLIEQDCIAAIDAHPEIRDWP